MTNDFFPVDLIDGIGKTPLFQKTLSDYSSVCDLKMKNSWDIIFLMEDLISEYVKRNNFNSVSFAPEGVSVIGNLNDFYVKGIFKNQGNTIINCTKGKVILEDGVTLKNFNTIEGPAYIGKDTVLDSAVVRGPLITGKACRISGEIEETFIMDYVNKHHYGFIGHSVISSWVNLGAGTTNSDLKNNYSNVKMHNGSELQDTGRIKLGCIMGEHTKTAIGTMINTGAVLGPFCNIFEDIRESKYVRPFSWGGMAKSKYNLDKLISDIAKVMERRNVVLTSDYLSKIKNLYSRYSESSD